MYIAVIVHLRDKFAPRCTDAVVLTLLNDRTMDATIKMQTITARLAILYPRMEWWQGETDYQIAPRPRATTVGGLCID